VRDGMKSALQQLNMLILAYELDEDDAEWLRTMFSMIDVEQYEVFDAAVSLKMQEMKNA
jgi:hypothetical protein